MTVIKNKKELPYVSVITVNYNGERFLPTYFLALDNLSYPKDKLEVIFVDNASTDNSVSYVKENFPWVKIIRNNKNLGFAEGNNVAICQAKGEYIALLNNDTVVDKNWLLELVKIAQSDASIGACTSKILFCYDFLTLVIKSTMFNPKKEGISDDNRDLGIAVEYVKINNFKPKFDGAIYNIDYLEGFYGIEQWNNINYRWTSDIAKIRVPFSQTNLPLSINLRIGVFRSEKFQDTQVIFYIDKNEIEKITLPKNKFINYQLTIPKDIINSSKYKLINNAGSIIFKDGYGADRGFCERDSGQYDRVEEVFCACGASVLYKKEMLEDIGLFDEDFFMYYEDTDLSWRARFRGWRTYYYPASIVYHVHCGSSVEWSQSFIFHTDKNRIFMLIKNADINLAIKSLLRYFGFVILLVFRWFYSIITKLQNQDSKMVKLRVRVILTILKNLPLMLKKRLEIQKNKTVSNKMINKWMIKR